MTVEMLPHDFMRTGIFMRNVMERSERKSFSQCKERIFTTLLYETVIFPRNSRKGSHFESRLHLTNIHCV